MTSRRSKTTVAPVLSPDMEFVRDLDGIKDTALAAIQRKQGEYAAGEAEYTKQVERLTRQWEAEGAAMLKFISQQTRIVTGVNAAHEAIAAPADNVVPMKAAE